MKDKAEEPLAPEPESPLSGTTGQGTEGGQKPGSPCPVAGKFKTNPIADGPHSHKLFVQGAKPSGLGGTLVDSLLQTSGSVGAPKAVSATAPASSNAEKKQPAELPPKFPVKELTAMYFTSKWHSLSGMTCSHCGNTANVVADARPWLCGCGAVNATTWIFENAPPLHKRPVYGPTLSSVRLAHALARGRVGKTARRCYRMRAQFDSGEFVVLAASNDEAWKQKKNDVPPYNHVLLPITPYPSKMLEMEDFLSHEVQHGNT